MSCSADCYVKCNTCFLISCGFKHLCSNFTWATFVLFVVLVIWSAVFPCTCCKLTPSRSVYIGIALFTIGCVRVRKIMFLYNYFHCLVIAFYSSMLNLLIQLLLFFMFCCILFGTLVLNKVLLSVVRWLKRLGADLCKSSDQHPVSLPCWEATRSPNLENKKL